MSAIDHAPPRSGVFSRTLSGLVTLIIGTLLCLTPVTALIVLGWLMRRMRMIARRSLGLEWQTPDVPPHHGNWGPELPRVYRWAYDYSVPGAPLDFIPQNEPVTDQQDTAGDREVVKL